MPHRIVTKDGISIENIPDDVSPTDARVRDQVVQMRSAGQLSATFGQPLQLTPAQAAAVDPESVMAPGTALPVAPAGKVSDLVMSPQKAPVIADTMAGIAQGAGVLAEGVVKGAMSVPTMVADPISILINKIIPGANELPPSEGLTRIFRGLGVKEPENAAQEVLAAAARGTGSALTSLGAGAALAAGAPALGMGTVAQGVGQTMAAQPAAEIAGSTAGSVASKIAEQQGVGAGGQLAIGLGAGILGSRLASPSAAIKTAAVQSEDEIGDIIRKAAGGDKAARKTVADLAAINPQAREAARRLEIELPADVFSDNEQVRAAAGLGRSIAGGTEESAWRGTVKNAVERADQVLDEFGATFIEGAPAPAVASARVKDALIAAKKQLRDEAVKIYDEIDSAVPKSTPATFDSTKAMLADIATEVGETGMSSQEKKLLDMVADPTTTYGRLMREKNLIGQAIAKKDSPYGNMEAGALKRLYGSLAEDQLDTVGKYSGNTLSTDDIMKMQDDGIRDLYIRWSRGPEFDTKPSRDYTSGSTHAGLSAVPIDYWEKDVMNRRLKEYEFLRMKDPELKPYIYRASEIAKDSDGYSSIPAGTKPIGIWDEGNAAVNSGLKEKLISANLMYGKEREIGKKIVDLFGKDFAGSISDKMRMAITSSARGETGAFTRLMESVPDDLKKEVTATALASIARSGSGATKGQFGFLEFSKIYQGLRANKEVYKQVVKNLGPESDAVLRDLYEVSKRITDARANVLTTGKANQALLSGLTAQNLVEKALGSVVGRGAVAAAGAATGSALGGGAFGASVGAGMSSSIVESLTRGEKTKLEAVGKLFRSREFQDLIINAGKTDTITPAQAKALARSGAFQSFAKAVKLPVATDQLDTWILSAATAKTADMVKKESER